MLRELEILVSFLSFRLAGCGASQEWVQASRIPSARGESVAASTGDRYPNRETFFGCCASAEKQTANTISTTRKRLNPFSARAWLYRGTEHRHRVPICGGEGRSGP